MNNELYKQYPNDANHKFVMKIMNTCSMRKLFNHLTLKIAGGMVVETTARPNVGPAL